jgi:uncharacterized membrane protein
MSLQNHLRNTFLAGAFAAMPIAATVFIVYYVERVTRELFAKVGVHTPFLGLLLAVVAIYLLGLIVRSLTGRFFIRLVDRVLSHVPVLRDIYQAWKHVSITPGGKEGVYAKAALIGSGEGGRLLGFTSGEPVDGDPNTLCVFVPNAPNPINGRLYFVPRQACVFLEGVGIEEAFKSILSTGNYVPPALGAATVKAGTTTPPTSARTQGFVRT